MQKKLHLRTSSLLDSDSDPEIRLEVKTFATDLNPNLQVGDLVLLKDQQVERIEWPMGLIVRTFLVMMVWCVR